MRFDSGFWSNDTLASLGRLDVRYTMAVRTSTPAIATAIAAIAEGEWVDIDYTPDGAAQVAACEYKGRRLVVRRTRLTGRQAKLWPDWRHFGFLTDLAGTAVDVDAFHRRHAVVELAIRDLKEGAGMEHVPSGDFSANSAWLQCAVLAHNLIRWTATIGVEPTGHATVARTVRTRLIAVPARLVNLAGTMTLRGPRNWPWAEWFLRRLECLRVYSSPRPDTRAAAGRAADVHLSATSTNGQDTVDRRGPVSTSAKRSALGTKMSG